MNTLSPHRIIPELRAKHPRLWPTLSVDQRRIALEACHGQADDKTLRRAYRAALNTKEESDNRPQGDYGQI